MSVIDPAANQMEEVHCDREVETLLPSTDEEPQTESTERKKVYCTLVLKENTKMHQQDG